MPGSESAKIVKEREDEHGDCLVESGLQCGERVQAGVLL